MQNLLPEPAATLLPTDPGATAGELTPEQVAERYPTSSAAQAALAEQAVAAGQTITAYAHARTGYHRGWTSCATSSWKGHGPIPWSACETGVSCRCLSVLATAAARDR